ncbi:chitinase [Streptomyces hygroscopicus]|uniref:chitinase n=1 Tax=Streptomyces hygroscopicus TaxID=1912 RepID=UPI00223F6682|nr:chitinase [Streptomyces hygroscopicus]
MRYRTVTAASVLGVLLLSACSGSPGSSSHSSDPGSKDKPVASEAPGVGGKNALIFSENQKAAEAGSGFPARYAAPYVETWNPPSVMAEVRNATGLKYFNLAFIIDGGGCNAKFNGQADVTDSGWISAIGEDRAAGGDVIASFGGASGTEVGVSCTSVDSLKAQYKKVIDALDLTRVDFDIEGSALDDQSANDRRNKALAELQREYVATGKKLDVNYTLPVAPSGLAGNAQALLRNAVDDGLDVNMVNIMTMDYGDAEDMGNAAVQAATALHDQLKDIWPGKADAQLWAMEGNTPMIGVNDVQSEVFSTADAQTLVDFAESKNIQQIAFWALGRDRQCDAGGNDSQKCSGTSQSEWQFSRIMNGVNGELSRPQPPQDANSLNPSTSASPSVAAPRQEKSANSDTSSSQNSPPPTHVAGQVRCESGHPIVGVWVQTSHSADSRFAAWRGIGDGSTADWWTDMPENESYSLHIGCGGTPASWATENKTGTNSGTSNSFDCVDIAGDPRYETCTAA